MRRTYRPTLELLEDRLAPASLPADFAEIAVASGLTRPTAMEFSPDGKLFIAEQDGTMEVWKNGAQLRANFFANTPLQLYNPTTDTGLLDGRGERGLLGIAFDPNWATNRYVYVYYTYAVNADGDTGTPTTFRNRVSRFTVNTGGALALAGSEHIILELDNLSGATNHNGGAIHFGPDGKLYIAVGDNANGDNAQSLDTRHGKILRINPDGTIPEDNPTSFDGISGSPTGDNEAIWAVGLRNPFTFSFQPGTGLMHINDVGQNSWEEINVGAAGANYGWPDTEGDFDPVEFPDFTRPFYTYAHGSDTFEGFAVTGGAFYNPSNPSINYFPDAYQGDYFFADFSNDWINVIDLSTGDVTEFATNALGTVDLRVGADGSLYYLARGSGSVFRVTYTANPSFQQDAGPDGIVSMEAENFDANISQGGKSWTSYTATSGFSGARAMRATPNTGVITASRKGPHLDFFINFVETGVHYVWIRGIRVSNNDNSVHVSLDGKNVTSADKISGFTGSYTWIRDTLDGVVATINVTTVGIHTLNLWMREDGTVVDKIVLTTNPDYIPTGLGPAESARVVV